MEDIVAKINIIQDEQLRLSLGRAARLVAEKHSTNEFASNLAVIFRAKMTL